MEYVQENEFSEKVRYIKWSIIGGILLLILVAGAMIGCPAYKVYQQKKSGEAKLREAEFSRQIAVQEAKAKMESSLLLAQSDTIRAHGTARSNQIIGASISEGYLRWFWIDNIDKSNNVIYVPTEANLPILEAGRFNKPIVELPNE